MKEDNKKTINEDKIENQKIEEEITEEEMNEIINYISSWNYEKYEKDHEVREALQLLKNKMVKEEKEKEKLLNELRRKEGLKDEFNDISSNNKEKENMFQNKVEFNLENNKIVDNKEVENVDNINIIKKEISEEEKQILEKNWNNSNKPEYGEKIINEKGDKEIIHFNKKENQRVIIFYKKNLIYFFIIQVKTYEKKYNNLFDLIKEKPVLIPTIRKYQF